MLSNADEKSRIWLSDTSWEISKKIMKKYNLLPKWCSATKFDIEQVIDVCIEVLGEDYFSIKEEYCKKCMMYRRTK